MNKEAIKDHKDLGIYKIAFEAAMKIFELSKKFPVEERYSDWNKPLGWNPFWKGCRLQ